MTQPTIADVTRLIEAAKALNDHAFSGDVTDAMTFLNLRDELNDAISALPPDAGEYCVVPRHIVQECLEAEEHENKWALSQYLRGELRACLKGTT